MIDTITIVAPLGRAISLVRGRRTLQKGKVNRKRRRATVMQGAKDDSMFPRIRFPALSLLLAATLGVVACGGGNSSGMMASSMSQPQMKLSVADAPPADNATHVVVVFTGVELTG